MAMSHPDTWPVSAPRMREPWSFRKQAAVLGLSSVLFVVGGPWLRDLNERQWCAGAKVQSQAGFDRCMAEQKAIRSGPLGIFHSPSGVSAF